MLPILDIFGESKGFGMEKKMESITFAIQENLYNLNLEYV